MKALIILVKCINSFKKTGFKKGKGGTIAPSPLAPVGPIPWFVFSKSFTVWYQFTLANNLLIGRPCCTLRLAYNFSNTKLNKKGGTTLSMSFGLGQLTLVRRASGGGQRSWKMRYCYISLIFNVMLPNIRWATSGKKLRGGFQVMKIWKTYLISSDLHLKKSFVRTGKTRSQTMLMVPKIALTSRSSLASIGTNSRSSGKETNKKERRKNNCRWNDRNCNAHKYVLCEKTWWLLEYWGRLPGDKLTRDSVE